MRTKSQARASTKSTDTGATGIFSKPARPFPISTGRTENPAADETPQARGGVSSLESRRLTGFPRDSAPVIQAKAQNAGRQEDDGPARLDAGNQLHPTVRRHMETAFGADFSDVRVHQSPEPESMGAAAYTRGKDIHFAPGQYDPASLSGQKLIGHELTHVVQQRVGRVVTPAGDGPPINASPQLESEADAVGARAARGENVERTHSHAPMGMTYDPTTSPPIQLGILDRLFGRKKRQATPEETQGLMDSTAPVADDEDAGEMEDRSPPSPAVVPEADDADDGGDTGGSVATQTRQNIKRHNENLSPKAGRVSEVLAEGAKQGARLSAVTSILAPPAAPFLKVASTAAKATSLATSKATDMQHQRDEDIQEQAEPLVPHEEGESSRMAMVRTGLETAVPAALGAFVDPLAGQAAKEAIDKKNAAKKDQKGR